MPHVRPAIRVLVADDDPFFRLMVATVLAREDDIHIVGEATNGREALVRTRELGPEVVLLDVVMPAGGGAEAARALREDHPTINVVMVTGSDDETEIDDCLRLGARGYLLKRHVVADLAGVIRIAHQRLGVVLSSTIIDRVLDVCRVPLLLSERELEVLTLVAGGGTNDDIARDLWLSAHTVKRHVANILAKLHERTRADAVRHAVRIGLLPSAIVGASA